MDRHGRQSVEASVLARLSKQSQQVQAEVYHSLQHMRLQRAQLQTSLRQQRETSDNNKELDQIEVSCTDLKNELSNIKRCMCVLNFSLV